MPRHETFITLLSTSSHFTDLIHIWSQYQWIKYLTQTASNGKQNWKEKKKKKAKLRNIRTSAHWLLWVQSRTRNILPLSPWKNTLSLLCNDLHRLYVAYFLCLEGEKLYIFFLLYQWCYTSSFAKFVVCWEEKKKRKKNRKKSFAFVHIHGHLLRDSTFFTRLPHIRLNPSQFLNCYGIRIVYNRLLTHYNSEKNHLCTLTKGAVYLENSVYDKLTYTINTNFTTETDWNYIVHLNLFPTSA